MEFVKEKELSLALEVIRFVKENEKKKRRREELRKERWAGIKEGMEARREVTAAV